MTTISEAEFERISQQIYLDRKQIYTFNQSVPHNEVLLWMLVACLIGYLNLSEAETPYFPGTPNADNYLQAVLHILSERGNPVFKPQKYLGKLINPEQ